jgi:hypothetical protein
MTSSLEESWNELASLQESARKMALERFRIIQPHLEQDRSLSLIRQDGKYPVSHDASMADSISSVWLGARLRVRRAKIAVSGAPCHPYFWK